MDDYVVRRRDDPISIRLQIHEGDSPLEGVQHGPMGLGRAGKAIPANKGRWDKFPPKPKPRWDVHLPEVGDRAGSLAGGIRPLIAGPCGSGA